MHGHLLKRSLRGRKFKVKDWVQECLMELYAWFHVSEQEEGAGDWRGTGEDTGEGWEDSRLESGHTCLKAKRISPVDWWPSFGPDLGQG